MIQNIKEMNSDELQCIVYEHIEKLLIRNNQHSDAKFIETTTGFVIEYLQKNCSEFTKFDLESLFSQIGTGEIKSNIQNKGVNTNEIIECVKMYKNSFKQVKKTIFNSHTDIARSRDNIERVKESLKKGIVDPKAFYSASEYAQLNPVFAQYFEILKNGINKNI